MRMRMKPSSVPIEGHTWTDRCTGYNRTAKLLLFITCLCALFDLSVSTPRCVNPAVLNQGDVISVALPVWLIDQPYGVFKGRIADTAATNIEGLGTTTYQPYLLGLDLYLTHMQARNNSLPLPSGVSITLNFVIVNLANKPGTPQTNANYSSVDPVSGIPNFMIYSMWPGIKGSAADKKNGGIFSVISEKNTAILNATFGISAMFTFIIPPPFVVGPPLTTWLDSGTEDEYRAIMVSPYATHLETFICDGIPYNSTSPASATSDCLDPRYVLDKIPGRGRHEGARRFETLLAIAPDVSASQQTNVEQFRTMGVRNIVIIRDGLTSSSTASYWTALRVKSDAESLNMQVLEIIVLEDAIDCDRNRTSTTSNVPAYCPPNDGLGMYQTQVFANRTTALQMAEHLQSLNPDGLFILGNSRSAAGWSIAQLLLSFRTIGWTPQAMSFGGGIDDWIYNQWLAEEDRSVMNYAFTVAPWHKDLRGSQFINKLTPTSFELFPATDTMQGPMAFYLAFEAAYGPDANWGPNGSQGAHPMYDPNWTEKAMPTMAIAALQTMQKILEKGLSSDVFTLLQASKAINVPSIFRTIAFDQYGRTATPSLTQVMMQYTTPGQEKVVTVPYNIGVAPVYPIPTWTERQFRGDFDTTPADNVLIAFTSVGIFLCLALLVGVVKHWKSAVIRASTPFLCLVIIFGGIVMLASTYFNTSFVTAAHCEASSWLLTLGFTLTFAPLFVKTFRVYHIFVSNSKSLTPSAQRLADSQLFAAVIALVIIDLVVNLVWRNIGDGFITSLQVVDPLRPSLNYNACDFSGSTWAVYMHLGIKGALLLFGLCMTYLVRNAPSQFNESLYIAIAIYNVAVVVCFIIPIIHAQLGGRTTVYLVRGYAILFVVLATEVLLFIPKFFLIRRKENWIKKQAAHEVPAPSEMPKLAPVVITGVSRRTATGSVPQFHSTPDATSPSLISHGIRKSVGDLPHDSNLDLAFEQPHVGQQQPFTVALRSALNPPVSSMFSPSTASNSSERRAQASSVGVTDVAITDLQSFQPNSQITSQQSEWSYMNPVTPIQSTATVKSAVPPPVKLQVSQPIRAFDAVRFHVAMEELKRIPAVRPQTLETCPDSPRSESPVSSFDSVKMPNISVADSSGIPSSNPSASDLHHRAQQVSPHGTTASGRTSTTTTTTDQQSSAPTSSASFGFSMLPNHNSQMSTVPHLDATHAQTHTEQ